MIGKRNLVQAAILAVILSVSPQTPASSAQVPMPPGSVQDPTPYSTAAFAHHLSGIIMSVQGSSLVLRLRNGKDVVVDISEAQRLGNTGVLPIHQAVIVYGQHRSNGIFYVTSIGHISPSPGHWPVDT